MSDILNEAVAGLKERLAGKNLGGSVRFDIKDEGSIHVDGDQVRISDDDADCTLGASEKNFRKLLDGKLNPTMAVMRQAQHQRRHDHRRETGGEPLRPAALLRSENTRPAQRSARRPTTLSGAVHPVLNQLIDNLRLRQR